MCYHIITARGGPLVSNQVGGERMEHGMTNAEFDAFLETLAQLIEAKAKTVEEAAALVRDKKSKTN